MVSTENNSVNYTLSDPYQTLAIPFPFQANNTIYVFKGADGAFTLVQGVDYTILGAGLESGGSITLTGTATDAGDYLTILRDVPITQLTDYIANDRFPAEVHERAIDKLTMIDQQHDREIGRSFRVPVSEGAISPITKAIRSGKLFNFDANGTPDFSNSVQSIIDAAVAAAVIIRTGRTMFNILDFGAKPDGSDATLAIQAAIDANASSKIGVYVPFGTYRTTAPLVVNYSGFIMQGDGGAVLRSVIQGDHTSGEVLRIKARSPTLRSIAFSSTANRLAAVTNTGHGIFFAPDDVNVVAIISRQMLDDVYVQLQPTDGIYSANGCEFSRYRNVTVADCSRHGFVFDDGTLAGLTYKLHAPFSWTLDNVRAIENGGNGYVLGTTGIPAQQLIANNLQALGNAWDSTKRFNSVNAQVYCSVRGVNFNEPDIEDQQYDKTTTSSTGRARIANATPSEGFRFQRGRVLINCPYFSSLTMSINNPASGMTVNYPIIFAGHYGVQQPAAIVMSVANSVCRVVGMTADFSNGAIRLIKAQSTNASANIDGKERICLNSNFFELITGAIGTTEIQIVAGNLPQITEDFVTVTAQADTAPVDLLGRINFAGARDGVVVSIKAKIGETITVQDSGTSGSIKGIKLKSSPFVMSGTDGDVLVLRYVAAADMLVEQARVEP